MRVRLPLVAAVLSVAILLGSIALMFVMVFTSLITGEAIETVGLQSAAAVLRSAA